MLIMMTEVDYEVGIIMMMTINNNDDDDDDYNDW